MNVKTNSGIEIFVEDTKKSKFIMFDKPVRTIELSREESARLGATLIRDSKIGITADLRKLVDESYFLKPKKFREIKEELYNHGVPVKSASLNVILTKMVERGELVRTGQKGFYLYQQHQ